MNRWTRWLAAAAGNALLVIGSLVSCFFSLEIGLRLAGVAGAELRFTCFDPLMGNVYCPNVEATIGEGADARTLSTNGDGLADRDYLIDVPAGTRRIALLGDSMVAAVDLGPKLGIKDQWEPILGAAIGQPVEIMNFAVQGTGTWEQLQMYHLRARKYRAELVVLAFFWGNDVWNNSARAARGGPNPLRDEYRIRTADRIRAAQRAFSRWVWNHSLAYQALRTGQDRFDELRRQAAVTGWGAALSALRRDVTSSPAPARHLKTQLGTPEYDWNSADWELTRALLAKLNEQVRADGARLAVFGIPAIFHDRSKLPRAEFDEFLDRESIARFGLFDLYDRQSEDVFFRQFKPGDVHWTVEGHRMAATHTAPALQRLLGRTTR